MALPHFTIFKHHCGSAVPSFEIIERRSIDEARQYAQGLMADATYEKIEIIDQGDEVETVANVT